MNFNFVKKHFHRSNLLLSKNYYKILNLSPKASDTEIRKAYLTMAKLYHPDVNKTPGVKERFNQILEYK